MTPEFIKAVGFTLKWEGGDKITNDPKDPGGLTKYGISKRAFPNLDIANLTLEQAQEIYHDKYWSALNLDGKPFPIACSQFDAAVNCGVSRVRSWLTDGKLNEDAGLFNDRRERYYTSLADEKPVFKRYLRGWMNRLNDLRAFIKN